MQDSNCLSICPDKWHLGSWHCSDKCGFWTWLWAAWMDNRLWSVCPSRKCHFRKHCQLDRIWSIAIRRCCRLWGQHSSSEAGRALFQPVLSVCVWPMWSMCCWAVFWPLWAFALAVLWATWCLDLTTSRLSCLLSTWATYLLTAD